MSSDVETNIVAVERIKEYSETEQVRNWRHHWMSYKYTCIKWMSRELLFLRLCNCYGNHIFTSNF